MNTHYGHRSYSERNYYKKPFRKTRGFYILIIILIGVVSFVYFSIKRSTEDVEQTQKFTDQIEIPVTAAKVIFLSGKLESRPPNQNWQEIGQDYQIQSGDDIRTAGNAKAAVELPDKSIVRLSENAEIRLEQFGMADIIVEQISGQVFHRVNSNSTAIYRVKNKSTELTALGTGFNVLASGELTYLTVTDSKVKVKIYNADNIINMRTVDNGEKVLINPTLETNQMIKAENVSSSDLIKQDWFAWNLEQDRQANFSLGIFEKSIKLIVTEPAETKISTDQEKITIKGETDLDAEIFMSGKELENNGGKFQTEFLLSPGKNQIEITVKKGKNMNQKTMIVESTRKVGQITLAGEYSDNKATLNWQTKNISDFKEFKVLQGNATNPTFPNAPYHTVQKTLTSDEWIGLEKAKYFFRVCALTNDGKCSNYSNNLEINIGAENAFADITLTAAVKSDTVELKWTLNKSNNPSDGFKTLISQNTNPVYPGSSYHSLSSNERSDLWKKLSPGIYYFRVCLLKNNVCEKYSDNAKAVITESSDNSITLTGAKGDGLINLYWETNGLAITKGYKIIVSDEPDVSFPGLGHHLNTVNDAGSDVWDNLETGIKYYFRVCQNLGSTCGVYSNEVSFIF